MHGGFLLQATSPDARKASEKSLIKEPCSQYICSVLCDLTGPDMLRKRMNERLNITMPSEFVEAVDDYARSEHLSRSGLIREALKAFMREPELAAGTSSTAVDILSDRLRAFCAGQDDIVAAYLFGSALKGNAGPLSDVDVGLLLDATPLGEGQRGLLGSRLVDLSSRLPVALGVTRVDVVILNTAPVALAFRAVSGGRLVAGADDPARVRFEVNLLNRYLGYLPLERTYARALRERVLKGELVARSRPDIRTTRWAAVGTW